MKLYEDTGYLNFPELVDDRYPFTFVIGGRGTGKTYGAIKWALESGFKFLFMRRTQAQADIINKPDFSPFKPVADDLGMDVSSEPLSKYNAGISIDDEADYRGYTCALSTIASLRGFSAREVQAIIYDEFIPERHERAIRDEGRALLNAYETVNRNRELDGELPVKMFCLANSNDFANPIFIELELVKVVAGMIERRQEVFRDGGRGLQVIYLLHSKISEEKSKTALYRLSRDSGFQAMSLGNLFTNYDKQGIISRDIREYTPIASVGELTIYKHKSIRHYYVTGHKSGAPKTYTAGQLDIKRFNRDFYMVGLARLDNRVEFETISDKILFDRYAKLL